MGEGGKMIASERGIIHTFQTWGEQARTHRLERRLKTLDKTARPNGYTFFEVVFADGARKFDEEVVHFALEHGWSVWAYMGHGIESRRQLDTSEIQTITFSKTTNTIEIIMKSNLARIHSGEYISHYSLQPQFCALLPN